MKQIDLDNKEARISELEAEMECDRPGNLEEIDLSSAENILEELLAAFDLAIERNSQTTLRATTSRMFAAYEATRVFFANRHSSA